MKEHLTDQELVNAVLRRNAWTHQQLAECLTVSRVAITKLANGQTTLRSAMRRKLEQMMDGLILIEAEEQPK